MMAANELTDRVMFDLTIGQVRILHLALEKYIRNHDIILHDSKFSISEMKLLFADLSRDCSLCELLNNILQEHDNKPYKEKV
jgi:hypothetical protein